MEPLPINGVNEEDLRAARIGQISLNVSDVERAVTFYRDMLGLRFLFQVPKMAFFDCAGIRLLLGTPEPPQVFKQGSNLYFQVNDIHGLHRKLSARGVSFLGEPHLVAQLEQASLWMVFFRDPDGNTLALMSEVPLV